MVLWNHFNSFVPSLEASSLTKICIFQAHLNDRKADNHILCKRFDEAVICHKNAAELLLDAMQITSVTRVLEALQLQYEYHQRQEDIVQWVS